MEKIIHSVQLPSSPVFSHLEVAVGKARETLSVFFVFFFSFFLCLAVPLNSSLWPTGQSTVFLSRQSIILLGIRVVEEILEKFDDLFLKYQARCSLSPLVEMKAFCFIPGTVLNTRGIAGAQGWRWGERTDKNSCSFRAYVPESKISSIWW